MEQLDRLLIMNNGAALKNAVAMAPMTTYAGDDEGHLTQAEFAYYRARSNDVALLITGTTYTVPNGKGFSGQFYAGSDEDIPQLRQLADTIKTGGAKPILQIFHAGRMANPKQTGISDVVSASAIPAERPDAVTPRALTEFEIETIIQSFADVTLRAIQAGFSGVEIHGANTYLIQQFFSPHSNRRQDQWGGSIENRARFPLAIVDAVTQVVNDYAMKDFIVGYRLSPEELENPGITLDDTLYLVDRLAEKPLNYLHLSLQHYAQTSLRDPDDRRIIGALIRQRLNGRLPLMGAGSIWTKEDLNSAFQIFDLVAVGRALIADPDWLYKIHLGIQPDLGLRVSEAKERYVPEKMLAMLERTKRMPLFED